MQKVNPTMAIKFMIILFFCQGEISDRKQRRRTTKINIFSAFVVDFNFCIEFEC